MARRPSHSDCRRWSGDAASVAVLEPRTSLAYERGELIAAAEALEEDGRLRLSGLLSTLELPLKEAEANRLPYAQFLEIVFQDELNVREQRTIVRRHKAADFRELRSSGQLRLRF